MNVFDLDADLLSRYEAFARSFTMIRAKDISAQVEDIYRSGKFWPEPLIGVNPHFEPGRALMDLAEEGVVDPDLPKVFAFGADRSPISLHRHQDQSLSKALQGRNYIVTTGTGSGKSLCFFVPIIDRILKAKRAGAAPRTRAIVIYPMNALANSQREELEKFIEGCGIDPHLKPTFERYTGQESDTERKRIAAAKPDIILTNFMMLELLMTRQDGLDQEVITNMQGLEFLVLDELHTYRGRQGADVAMLVRRVRERLGAQDADADRGGRNPGDAYWPRCSPLPPGAGSAPSRDERVQGRARPGIHGFQAAPFPIGSGPRPCHLAACRKAPRRARR